MSNIGLSKIFYNYYKIHIIVKNSQDLIINETISDFDIRQLVPSKTVEPLAYNPAFGKCVKVTIPNIPIENIPAKVFLCIKDEKNIEFPLCLSNYGRNMESEGGDGSYLLGTINL